MKAWHVAGLMVAAVGALVGAAGAQGPGGAAAVNWLASWEEGKAAALQSKKPLFVAFR